MSVSEELFNFYLDSASLTSQWTCSIASLKNFGSDCGVVGPTNASSSIITVPANTMTLQVAYAFVVVATSLDGRSDSKRVLVKAVSAGSVQLYVNSTVTRFNPKAKLIVGGHLLASYAVTSVWSVLTPLGVPLPYDALTAKQSNITFTGTEGYMSFPLGLQGGVFTAGSSYSFRLTAYPVGNPKLATFSEITLIANLAPVGGYLLVVPSSGSALVTKFLLTTPAWTSTADSLPLVYSFAYTVSPLLSKYLTVASPSLKAHTISTLPPGLSALNNMITVRSKATDLFSSSSIALTDVSVTLDQSTDLSQVLNISVSDALSVGNINQVFQAVNNVSII
jgi:REJ domain